MATHLRVLTVALIAFAGCNHQQSPDTDDTPTAPPESRTTTSPDAQPTGFHQFTVTDIDGHDLPLARYRSNVVLVVNVASRCGYTPQYAGLQKLYDDYKDRGLVVLGVPSNDFGKQEPGTSAEIKAFCSANYGVTFPMLAKVHVADGPDRCDLYDYLTTRSLNGTLDADVAWNFNKFLIARDGTPIRHYPSKVKPDDPDLIAAIEAALAPTQ